MCAVKTSLQEMDTQTLKNILGTIRSTIPLGFNHHKTPHKKYMPNEQPLSKGVVEREYKSATYQIGSLGGGNHFIEIQEGSDGHIWIMIHSGSRNLGKQVADHYNRVAKELNNKWGKALPKGYDLAFLPLDSNQGQNYLHEMEFCLSFARANRALMLEFIKDAFRLFTDAEFMDEINIHHNYASEEEHFGKRVIVHRKGATAARAGQMGIIPGSQGTHSYIVKGKGNPESFMSCSHGAGRIMGRKEATRRLDFKTETARLDAAGILHSIRHQRDLDEAPGAYKDISHVMRDQEDLIDIVTELSPRAVIKG
jgi:tRNA-splicing ligase RtcB